MTENNQLLILEKPKILSVNYEIERKKSDVVLKLAKEIDLTNPNGILSFGAKPSEEIAKIADKILKDTKEVKNEEASNLLINLTKVMDKVKIDDFEKEPKKTNAINNAINKFFGKVQDVFAKYDSIEKNIDKITTELIKYKTDIDKGQLQLTELYKVVDNTSVELVDYIYALDIIEEKIKDQIEDIKNTENVLTEDKNNQISKFQSVLDRISQKKEDLHTTRTVSLQTMPMLDMMANNDYNLSRKIYSSLITTLPIFKEAIAIAVNLKRQRVISRTMKKVDEKTNELLLRNARNVAQNSVEIAQQSNSSSIDIETLKTNFEVIKKGIEDTKAIQNEARSKRENNIKELENLNKKMNELKF